MPTTRLASISLVTVSSLAFATIPHEAGFSSGFVPGLIVLFLFFLDRSLSAHGPVWNKSSQRSSAPRRSSVVWTATPSNRLPPPTTLPAPGSGDDWSSGQTGAYKPPSSEPFSAGRALHGVTSDVTPKLSPISAGAIPGYEAGGTVSVASPGAVFPGFQVSAPPRPVAPVFSGGDDKGGGDKNGGMEQATQGANNALNQMNPGQLASIAGAQGGSPEQQLLEQEAKKRLRKRKGQTEDREEEDERGAGGGPGAPGSQLPPETLAAAAQYWQGVANGLLARQAAGTPGQPGKAGQSGQPATPGQPQAPAQAAPGQGAPSSGGGW